MLVEPDQEFALAPGLGGKTSGFRGTRKPDSGPWQTGRGAPPQGRRKRREDALARWVLVVTGGPQQQVPGPVRKYRPVLQNRFHRLERHGRRISRVQGHYQAQGALSAQRHTHTLAGAQRDTLGDAVIEQLAYRTGEGDACNCRQRSLLALGAESAKMRRLHSGRGAGRESAPESEMFQMRCPAEGPGGGIAC